MKSADRTFALALIPSQGLGGGIEVFVGSVLEALDAASIEVVPVVMLEGAGQRPTPKAKASFAASALQAARRLRQRRRKLILCFLPAFAPLGLACAAASRTRATDVKVFGYGREIFDLSRWEAILLRRSRLELVTISSFSAGALASSVKNASILIPAPPGDRYRLMLASPLKSVRNGPLHVLSVFRLGDAHAKGARELVRAVEMLRWEGRDVELLLAGRGRLPSDVAGMASRPWIRVVESPSTEELAKLYALSDVFVLATRFTAGPRPSGEGFGLVLAEAQLAGLPVIAPALGGASDAYLPGMTGVAPADESPHALAAVLREAESDRRELVRAGRRARTWAAEWFSPDRFRRDVLRVLLEPGRGGP